MMCDDELPEVEAAESNLDAHGDRYGECTTRIGKQRTHPLQ